MPVITDCKKTAFLYTGLCFNLTSQINASMSPLYNLIKNNKIELKKTRP